MKDMYFVIGTDKSGNSWMCSAFGYFVPANGDGKAVASRPSTLKQAQAEAQDLNELHPECTYTVIKINTKE